MLSVSSKSRRKRSHSPGRRSHDDEPRRKNKSSAENVNQHASRNKIKSQKEETSSRRNENKEEVGKRYWRRDKHEEGDAEKKDDTKKKNDEEAERKKKNEDLLTTRTGGAYIPPARLRLMQKEISDKSSIAYQRLSWEALKKSIHGLINKVNVSNIGLIVRSLLKENIVRGRGLLCRSIMQAQAASPTFTNVYASLVAVINTKFPSIGELILKRLIIQFRRGFRRNDKDICMSATGFIAHLVNQQVAHEILALETITLLMETPTDNSIEVGISFLKECGAKLDEVTPKGMTAVFERLRHILHEGDLDKRVQYMIEVMFQVRKDKFKDNVPVSEDLDLVEEEDQYTHMKMLEEGTNSEDLLNVFRQDPDFEANEEKYKSIRHEILDESSSGSEGEEDSQSESEETDPEEQQKIIDNTETNLAVLRRTIYLTIQSSLDYEECTHKLLKMELKPGQEVELCHMILDCCAQQRTYEKFFGLLAQRFCQINHIYIAPFSQIFHDSYDTIHRLETNKLRNIAKFFAHLLYTDAISWEVLCHIRLNEEDTTSSSRIFIKILFQELSEYLGLTKLNERIKDPTLQGAFEGLFPRDNPKNTRFAINFFTSIGLGGLTDDLREHLKNQPKTPVIPLLDITEEQEENEPESQEEEESSSEAEVIPVKQSKKNSRKSSKHLTTDMQKTKGKSGKIKRKETSESPPMITKSIRSQDSIERSEYQERRIGREERNIQDSGNKKAGWETRRDVPQRITITRVNKIEGGRRERKTEEVEYTERNYGHLTDKSREVDRMKYDAVRQDSRRDKGKYLEERTKTRN